MDSNTIFASIRRGYSEFNESEPTEILDYFKNLDEKSLVGHISNIKGIVFENEIVESLNNQGINAALFEATNHPITDIAIFEDDEIINEFQLKATDSVEYIRNTLEANSDVPIITTSEVASYFENESMVIDSGISNSYLTDSVSSSLIEDYATEISSEIVQDAVSDTLADTVLESTVGESLLPIPISPVGLLIKGLLWLL